MSDEIFTEARILLVDDDAANISLLENFLKRAGHQNLRSTTDPRQVLPIYLDFEPDLLILDLNMPHLDGYAVLHQLGPRIPDGTYLPILVLTADITPEAKRRALASGARDFLTKPFDPIEVRLRVRNLLETRFLHRQLQSHSQKLEEEVRSRTRELEGAQLETLERLALAAEYRDDVTGEHTQRVGRISALIAQELGLSEGQVELIRRAAPLHDVGKIGTPDRILLKPAKLTPEEFDEMKNHITIGAKILSGSHSPLLQLAEEIALTHHERTDGMGYMKLVGEAIPLPGRIVAVADAFDAMTHQRPYKEAWPIETAATEIKQQTGRQFDPQVVAAFLRVLEQEGKAVLRHAD